MYLYNILIAMKIGQISETASNTTARPTHKPMRGSTGSFSLASLDLE